MSDQNYLSCILDKLGLSTRIELILYAVSQSERSHAPLRNRQKIGSGDV